MKFGNQEGNVKTMQLSDQALGAVMMALQKSLLEQTDIVPVLKGFKLTEADTGELVVTNPPVFKVGHDDMDVITSATDIED
tara:strand:- start:770 stop:1012 length:243 start_codon:yes stop_codon:yes gene_type:complete